MPDNVTIDALRMLHAEQVTEKRLSQGYFRTGHIVREVDLSTVDVETIDTEGRRVVLRNVRYLSNKVTSESVSYIRPVVRRYIEQDGGDYRLVSRYVEVRDENGDVIPGPYVNRPIPGALPDSGAVEHVYVGYNLDGTGRGNRSRADEFVYVQDGNGTHTVDQRNPGEHVLVSLPDGALGSIAFTEGNVMDSLGQLSVEDIVLALRTYFHYSRHDSGDQYTIQRSGNRYEGIISQDSGSVIGQNAGQTIIKSRADIRPSGSFLNNELSFDAAITGSVLETTTIIPYYRFGGNGVLRMNAGEVNEAAPSLIYIPYSQPLDDGDTYVSLLAFEGDTHRPKHLPEWSLYSAGNLLYTTTLDEIVDTDKEEFFRELNTVQRRAAEVAQDTGILANPFALSVCNFGQEYESGNLIQINPDRNIIRNIPVRRTAGQNRHGFTGSGSMIKLEEDIDISSDIITSLDGKFYCLSSDRTKIVILNSDGTEDTDIERISLSDIIGLSRLSDEVGKVDILDLCATIQGGVRTLYIATTSSIFPLDIDKGFALNVDKSIDFSGHTVINGGISGFIYGATVRPEESIDFSRIYCKTSLGSLQELKQVVSPVSGLAAVAGESPVIGAEVGKAILDNQVVNLINRQATYSLEGIGTNISYLSDVVAEGTAAVRYRALQTFSKILSKPLGVAALPIELYTGFINLARPAIAVLDNVTGDVRLKEGSISVSPDSSAVLSDQVAILAKRILMSTALEIDISKESDPDQTRSIDFHTYTDTENGIGIFVTTNEGERIEIRRRNDGTLALD